MFLYSLSLSKSEISIRMIFWPLQAKHDKVYSHVLYWVIAIRLVFGVESCTKAIQLRIKLTSRHQRSRSENNPHEKCQGVKERHPSFADFVVTRLLTYKYS